MSKKPVSESIDKKLLTRFIILSIIGIFLFFIPVQGANVPVVVLINLLKTVLGQGLVVLVILLVLSINTSLLLGKVFKVKWFAEYHKNDSIDQMLFYVIALISVICILFNVGPDFIYRHEKIGGEILPLSGTIMSTIVVAGWLIFIVLKSGLVEFIGIILEPIMRPIFKLPGEAAVDCLSSFVVSPSVGIYLTDQYYQSKVYTRREAIAAASCFSTTSVGFIAVLASMGGMEESYGMFTICTLLMVFVMTAICMRIPPLSKYAQVYADGSTKVDTKAQQVEGSRLNRALKAATTQCQEFSIKGFILAFGNAVKFGQRIVPYMMALMIITLTLVYHTPVFTWMGKPFEYLFEILQLPNAAEIAAAPILGFISITLPVISISGQAIAEQSIFFVIMLSIVQIIFMTEAGNAMLSSSMKIKFKDVLFLFIVRTLIAIPILAGLSHLLF